MRCEMLYVHHCLRITVTRELHSTTFEMNSSLHIRREERPTSPWVQRINLAFSQVSICILSHVCTLYIVCVFTLCWDIVFFKLHEAAYDANHIVCTVHACTCVYIMYMYNVYTCTCTLYIVCVCLHCAQTLSSMRQLTMHGYIHVHVGGSSPKMYTIL